MTNSLVISEVKEGMHIEYTGDSFAFGGRYRTITSESTYVSPSDCPEEERGKLMIIEFMNNGNPMYFTLDRLDLEKSKLIREEE